MSSLPPADLAPLPALDGLDTESGLKVCCAAVYEHPAVRWLLGGELHPGGAEGTLRALELGGVGAGDRLLDVASGQGDSALLAARELGCEVVGLEYGEGAVAAATAAAHEAGVAERATFLAGDAEQLPFGAAEFDAVLCECSLCTFPDKPTALAEMSRVVRPAGKVVVSDVVVDRDALPDELGGPLSVIACVGDALDRAGYERLIAAAGLELDAVEERSADAARLAGRVHDRLRGARLLGFERLPGAPLTTSEAVAVLAGARAAIDSGALGYAIFAAAAPELARPAA